MPPLAARSALIFSSRAAALFSPLGMFRVFRTPLGGQLAAEGLRRDRLGEAVDAGQGVVDLLFNGVGVGEELFDAADDFALFLSGGSINGSDFILAKANFP